MVETSSSFNLLHVAQALKRRSKTLALFVLVVLVLCTIVLFLLPKYYKSTAIAIAANPVLADKARLFNPNIESLYSNFGSSDDLDRIYGIAQLDTAFKMLVNKFGLVDYYKLKDENAAVNHRNAVLKLRDDLAIQKTELYQLKVTAWNKNPQVAADIANSLVEFTQAITQNTWKQAYASSLEKLDTSIATMEKEYNDLAGNLKLPDGLTGSAGSIDLVIDQRNALLEQVKEYKKSANEFKLAIENDAPALIVLEAAYPSAKADKPRKPEILMAAFIISLVFGSLAVLLLDRKQAKQYV